jgi:hypothetical protein
LLLGVNMDRWQMQAGEQGGQPAGKPPGGAPNSADNTVYGPEARAALKEARQRLERQVALGSEFDTRHPLLRRLSSLPMLSAMYTGMRRRYILAHDRGRADEAAPPAA